MIEKLQGRLPLKSAIVRYSSCLAPHNAINDKGLCIWRFEKLAEKLYNNSIISVKTESSKNEFLNSLPWPSNTVKSLNDLKNIHKDFIRSLQNI